MTNSSFSPNSVIPKKAKNLLIFLSIFLVVANLYFLSSTRELARSYSDQQNQATWFLFQLTKEFSELNAITPYSLVNEDNLARTKLKYELTWSRFDLLLSSEEADTFMRIKGAKLFFSDLFSKYQSLEPKFDALEQIGTTDFLTVDLNRLYNTMIQYVNSNFRIKSPLYKQQMQQAQWLTYIQFLLILLLFTCIGLVSYIFHRDAIYHRTLSLTDPLTNIANRLAFFRHLEACQQCDGFTLYLLDLNNFKQINDTYGHQAGDSTLLQISNRLVNQISARNYSVFRIGGDEFAVVLTEIDKNIIEKMKCDILLTFSKPIMISHNEYYSVSTSVGYSSYPHDANDIKSLVASADLNMYSMKKESRY